MANNRELSQFANVVGYDGGNVGINESSSIDARLHVNSGTDNTTLFLESTDGDVNLGMADNAGSCRLLQAGGNLRFRTGGNANAFGTGDSERMVLDSNGNLGINRTDPNQRLNVSGNIEVNAYDNTGGSGGYNTSSGLIIGNLYDAGKSYTGSDDRTACIWQERGLDLDFATNDTLKMKITYDGKVGVGTNVPARLVHLHESNSNEALITFTTPTTGVTASDGFRVGMNGSEEALVWNNESGIIKFGTANTERLRIKSNGHIHIGNPVELADVATTTHTFALSGNSDNTFSCPGSVAISGATAYNTANYAGGGIRFLGKYNASGQYTTFAHVGGIKENTTDGNYAGALTFHTRNHGGLGAERLRITSGGEVHIGDSLGNNHSGMFQVIHEGGGNQTNDCLAFFETNANDWCIMTNSNEGGSANHYHMYFQEEGSVRGSIYGNHGSNVTYGQGSDYRWKENIIDLTGTEGIDICKRLRPRKYNWIKNREGTGQINTVDGFIAHEVQEAGVLGAVTGEKDAVNEDGSIDGQMLDYGQMTPVLAAAIKGLIAKVETLEAQVTALENP